MLSGKAHGRASPGEVTIFDSVGFALEDFSALRYLHGLNQEQHGARHRIDLVPDLDDPKNLFAGLASRIDAARRVLGGNRPVRESASA